MYIFYAQPDDQAAAMSFSALVNALYETNSVAIVRRAYSGSSAPRIGFLAPHIKANYEVRGYRVMVGPFIVISNNSLPRV